jgi:hypothetical protein
MQEICLIQDANHQSIQYRSNAENQNKSSADREIYQRLILKINSAPLSMAS